MNNTDNKKQSEKPKKPGDWTIIIKATKKTKGEKL